MSWHHQLKNLLATSKKIFVLIKSCFSQVDSLEWRFSSRSFLCVAKNHVVDSRLTPQQPQLSLEPQSPTVQIFLSRCEYRSPTAVKNHTSIVATEFPCLLDKKTKHLNSKRCTFCSRACFISMISLELAP